MVACCLCLRARHPIGDLWLFMVSWSSLAQCPHSVLWPENSCCCCLLPRPSGDGPDYPAISPRNLPEILHQSGAPLQSSTSIKLCSRLVFYIRSCFQISEIPPENTDFGFAALLYFIFFTVTVLNLGRKTRQRYFLNLTIFIQLPFLIGIYFNSVEWSTYVLEIKSV